MKVTMEELIEQDFIKELDNVNRFEYIDETGRVVVKYLEPNERFVMSMQDDQRTLKIILSKTS